MYIGFYVATTQLRDCTLYYSFTPNRLVAGGEGLVKGLLPSDVPHAHGTPRGQQNLQEAVDAYA
jgi:hypothetical protein